MSEMLSKETVATSTPGPWKLNDPNDVSAELYGGEDGYQLITAGSGAFPDGFYLAGFMSAKNAKLIVAAPALLALARQFASECAECTGTGISEDTGKDCESCDDIRAVIAEAV